MGLNVDQFDPDEAGRLRAALDSETGQLPLFASPGALLSVVRPNPGDRRRHRASGVVEDDSMFWQRKLNESSEGRLRASMAEEGMKRAPRVTASTGTVKDGHHRLAVAAADQPDTLVHVDWEKDENGPVGDGWGKIPRVDAKKFSETPLDDLLGGPMRLEP